MNHQLKKLQKEAQNTRLTPAERMLMRAQIFGNKQVEASPYVPFSFSLRFVVASSLVLVVLVSSGTVYAAQGTLPGDALYTIKVNVTEPVREALAFSPAARAEFHTSVVQTRLEEAETLAVEGRLNTSSTLVLEDNLQKHIVAVQVITETLAIEDPDTAEEVATALNSSLSAHGQVLARLGDESANDDTREHSERLVRIARPTLPVAYVPSATAKKSAKSPAVATATAQTLSLSLPQEESDHPATSTAKIDTIATTSTVQMVGSDEEDKQKGQGREEESKTNDQLQKRASKELAKLQKQFAKVKKGLDASTTAELEERLAAIRASIEAGESTQALREGIELSTFITASEKFNGSLLERLLGRERNGRSSSNSD